MKNKKKKNRKKKRQHSGKSRKYSYIAMPSCAFAAKPIPTGSENLKISRSSINSLVRGRFQLLILPINHANLSPELSYMSLYLQI